MKRLIPLLALGLLLAACNSAYQSPQPVEQTQQVLSEAEKEARELEARKHLSFAHEYYKQSKYEEAKGYYLKVFALDSDDKHIKHLKRLATCYSRLSQPDSARYILEQAVEKLPESHYERRTLSDLLYRAGETDAAFSGFQICVELDPEDTESWRDISKILTARAEASDSVEDWDKVLDVLDVLIELQPEKKDWADRKDVILAQNYDPEEVIASLRANHKSFPDDMKVAGKLARALVEYASPETYSEALPILDKLLASDADNVRLLDLKANALEGKGQGGDAARVLIRMTELQPENKELHARVSELYLNLGNLKQARNWAQRTKRNFTSYGKGYILMAKVYEAAVDKCAGSELSFDDKLVYEFASKEYDKVRDPAFKSTARQRKANLEEVLPTKEDRFFNKNDVPEGECYQWLFK